MPPPPPWACTPHIGGVMLSIFSDGMGGGQATILLTLLFRGSRTPSLTSQGGQEQQSRPLSKRNGSIDPTGTPKPRLARYGTSAPQRDKPNQAAADDFTLNPSQTLTQHLPCSSRTRTSQQGTWRRWERPQGLAFLSANQRPAPTAHHSHRHR